MHIRIFSVSLLGVTMIGAHHSVGSVMGVMIPCSNRRSSYALSLSRKVNETACGVLMQNGLASSVRAM